MTSTVSTIRRLRPRLSLTLPSFPRERTYSPRSGLGRKIAKAAALRAQIDDLTKALEPLRAEILASLESGNVSTARVGDVVVTRRLRHNWSYTPDTEREILSLRQTQKWEQSEGLATDAPTAYIAINIVPGEP